MSNIKLTAYLRKKGEKLPADKIAAVVYGPKTDNQTLTVNYKEFERAYTEAGESTLIDLIIDGKGQAPALIHQIQYDPLSGRYIHVDFYQIDMDKKIKVEIDLILEGIEEAEKKTGGEAVVNLDKIHVECSPKDLVRYIKFDVSQLLNEIGDVVYVRDIQLPNGLKLITEEEIPVVSLQEIKEEIIEPAPEEAEAAEAEKTEAGEEEKKAEEAAEKSEAKEDKEQK